jgi:hypothetical protein
MAGIAHLAWLDGDEAMARRDLRTVVDRALRRRWPRVIFDG